MISLIVAKARNNAIGRGNKMPWHISGDLKYFKQVTYGHPVVMGYNTWLSLGERPLPGRENIVVSGRHTATAGCGAEFCASLGEGIALARVSGPGSEEVFVIGGGQLYRQAMPLADRLYITEVEAVIDDAEVFFPDLDANADWKLTETDGDYTDNGYTLSFNIYRKNQANS